jgi:hypothetical protein
MYATTRYNFVRLKATHKISPLEESILIRIEEWFQDILLKKLIPKYDCVASSYVLQDFS